MTDTKHTPTPYRENINVLSDGSINIVHIVAANGNMVAQVANYGDDHCKMLVASIVHACNNIERVEAENAALRAACELFTSAAHDARDALNGAGIACPASIAFAAEKARAAVAKAQEGA